jgi:hypothetical protein
MVDLRGMGEVGGQQTAAAAVPSLLQMAQGEAPALGGGLNPADTYDPYNLAGPSAQQYHGMFDPSGAEDRIRTASFLGENPNARMAPWATQPARGQVAGSVGLDESGQPITAGAPPSYGGQDGLWPGIFSPQAPRSGWFNLQDYYKGAPAQADNPAAQNVPTRFSAGSDQLSTNDWRLLPPQYRSPNYFQANGRIIDRNLGSLTVNPSAYSYLGQTEMGSGVSPINRGTSNETGSPRISWSGWDASTGWPGQLSPWSHWSTPNY